MSDIGKEYITQARQLASNGCYSKAFDVYITAFEKCSRLRRSHELEFRNVANRLNEVLAQTERIDEIFANYGRALAIYPSNMHLLNDIGKYLYKFGFYAEAWSHFQKALRLDSCFVAAEKNLNSVKAVLFEQWHYRMLNDKATNKAYYYAIKDTIDSYLDSVVDLGAGTCLLSLFAHKHRPISVTAIERSEIMTQLGECVTQGMGVKDIIIINKISTKMNFRDIGGKRSFLVTELFDAGLFGENILESMVHAWDNLISENGRVLPAKAEFFLVGGNCDRLHHKYELSKDAKTMLNIPNMRVHLVIFDETYEAEDVHLFKDLEYLTEDQSVLKIDFNSRDDLNEKFTRTEPYKVPLKSIKPGKINVYIGWFNLYLTDKICITTNPRSRNKALAWQQIVFFDTVDKEVKADQTVNVDVLLTGGKLAMATDPNINVERVTPELMRFLNDHDLIKLIRGSIGMACVYLGQITDISQMNLVDLSSFPVFGLLMLRRGVQGLTCYAKTTNDESFFKKVFDANGICPSRVKILVGEEWTAEAFGSEKYHAIFANILDQCGDAAIHQRELALHLKESHLYPNGLFMPANVKIVAQVVTSKWLDLNNIVYNENTCGYDLARHVYKYEVTQNFFIDLANLQYTPLTDAVVMGSLMSQSRSANVTLPVKRSGEANAVLCWYLIELMENLTEMTTNRPNCFTLGTAFLTQKVELTLDKQLKLTRVSDPDGSYKIFFELQTT